MQFEAAIRSSKLAEALGEQSNSAQFISNIRETNIKIGLEVFECIGADTLLSSSWAWDCWKKKR